MASYNVSSILPVICFLLPIITMRRCNCTELLNFKNFIVVYKLTRTDKIKTKKLRFIYLSLVVLEGINTGVKEERMKLS